MLVRMEHNFDSKTGVEVLTAFFRNEEGKAIAKGRVTFDGNNLDGELRIYERVISSPSLFSPDMWGSTCVDQVHNTEEVRMARIMYWARSLMPIREQTEFFDDRFIDFSNAIDDLIGRSQKTRIC